MTIFQVLLPPIGNGHYAIKKKAQPLHMHIILGVPSIVQERGKKTTFCKNSGELGSTVSKINKKILISPGTQRQTDTITCQK